MSIDPQDPRLTAYALGEMDGSERAAFEAELDADARAEIEAIQQTAELVGAEMASQSTPGLSPEQRTTITAAAGKRSPRWWAWGVAAAAALLFIVPPFMFLGSETAPGSVSYGLMGPPAADAAMAPMAAGGEGPLPMSRDSRYTAGVGSPQTGSEDFYMGFGRSRFYAAAGSDATGSIKRRFDVTALPNTEAYDRIRENAFLDVNVTDTSTFSIDVDTASYANVRRMLEQDQLPPADAVRIEELVNYFRYDDEAPNQDAKHPFRAHVEIAGCPWNTDHRLARIALKGKVIPFEDRPPMNLVFLIDVSGSMKSPNKLTLVKQAAKKLVAELGPTDQMAIAVYAGAAGLVLPTTPCNEQEKIFAAIDQLESGGSTNGGQGIQLAYDAAAQHFIRDGVNRVILATDGDFNVGVSDTGSLVRMVEDRAKEGIYLSVLGFGMGNYKDAMLEQISNSGNGNYAYIDSLDEACRVLVDGLGGTLVTIAKDVKIQIFFNPEHVAGYRLIGYENRMLQAQDFNNDAVDAGEIGVGHAVTALYEIVPAGTDLPGQGQTVDENPFVPRSEPSPVADSDAWFRLRMRYKEPAGDTSTLMEEDAADSGTSFDKASTDFQFSASVASFGMLLRNSEHAGSLTMDGVLEIAESNLGEDQDGSRSEFLRLVQRARELLGR